MNSKKKKQKKQPFQNKQATSSHIALNSNNNKHIAHSECLERKKETSWRKKNGFVSSAATVARINTRLRFY